MAGSATFAPTGEPITVRANGSALQMNTVILKLLAQRIVLALASLLAVSVIVFAITAVLPGDAAQEQLGQEATPEALAALRAQMGLDKSAPERYGRWLGGLARVDLGESSSTRLVVRVLLVVRRRKSLQFAGTMGLSMLALVHTRDIA